MERGLFFKCAPVCWGKELIAIPSGNGFDCRPGLVYTDEGGISPFDIYEVEPTGSQPGLSIAARMTWMQGESV